jgi:hypothetical protein
MTSEQEVSPGGLVRITPENQNPMILDKVDYVYATYAQFMVSNLDFRIAVGDRTPTDGSVKPLIGITLPHEVAKAFLKAMTENVPKIDVILEQMAQPNKQ